MEMIRSSVLVVLSALVLGSGNLCQPSLGSAKAASAAAQAQPPQLPLAAAAVSEKAPLTADAVSLPTFGALVESVKAAVVNVEVQARAAPEDEQDPNELFNRFFGGGRRGMQAPRRQEPLRQGAGSGFIIDPNGIVLTNNHVVEQAVNIKVRLEDGREFAADVQGRDPLTDLAVLKLKGGKVEQLPAAKLGDSDAIKVGDWVVAIGNPFGLSSSVSAGILSAKARQIHHSQYDDFLQTDAAINPGNSGGPLFNTRGEVIGINTAIIGGGTGIGFAVPINIAKALLPQLQASGEVTRGYLGVAIQDLNADLAQALRVPVSKGAIVAEVEPKTPAEKAGLRSDDVIISIDGTPVESGNALTRMVALKRPGSTSTLELYRQGQRRTLPITLERRRPEIDGLRPAVDTKGGAQEERQQKIGLEFQEVDARTAQYLGVPREGVLITAVTPGSPAERAELAPGMVVLEAGGKPVRNTNDLAAVLNTAKSGSAVLLRIQAGQRRALKAVTVP